jgi:hypothetical protein
MDPTLNEIREEIAEEREIAAEKARLDIKVGLLKQLASVSEALDKDIDNLKTRRDLLKGARKAVKAVADNEDLTKEEIVGVLTQVNSARGIVSFAVDMPAGLFADGGVVGLLKNR